MYTHEQIWTAIEEVARQRRWTNSKLAIQAGLNSTALNRSKRTNPTGKPHWPSSETIAKLLCAAGISLQEFVSFIEGSSGSVGTQAGNGGWLAPSDASDRPAAPLVADDLIVTERLAARPAPRTRLGAVIDALEDLSGRMIHDPASALSGSVQYAVQLCNAGSAGISVLDAYANGEKFLRWDAVAGRLAPFVGANAPRNLSPSGLCLDRGHAILVAEPGRMFPHLKDGPERIVEALIVPIYDGDDDALGTAWIVAHDRASCHFSLESLNILRQLSIQASLALKLLG